MITFSSNRNYQELVDKFILVYSDDLETLTPDHAHNKFMKCLLDEGVLRDKEYKQHGATNIYDEERERKFGHDYTVSSSDFLYNEDKFSSYTPIEPVVDQYEDFIDDIFTAHLIKDLLSPDVLTGIIIQYGFNMERCFKNPKLFDVTPNMPKYDMISKQTYYTPDRKQVLLDTIRGLGYNLEDINISKLCQTLYNTCNQEDDNNE